MSHTVDWIPGKDAGFHNFQAAYIKILTPNVGPDGSWGIPQAPLDALLADKAEWDARWAVARNKQDRTPAQTKSKTASRTSYEKHLRRFTREFVRNNSNIPGKEKIRMGVRVPSGKLVPVPAPGSNPSAQVDKQDVGRHKIFYRDEGSSPGRGRPHGADFCEIRYMISETQPVDSEDYPHTVLSKRSGQLIIFNGGNSGNRAWYILRWVSTRGEGGPWSPAISAIIT